jgi:hypothetical protein
VTQIAKRPDLRSRAVLAAMPVFALLVLLIPRAATAAVSVGATIDLPWSQVDFLGGTVAVLANGSFAITTNRVDLLARQVQFFNAAGDPMSALLLKPPVVSPEYVGVGSLGRSYFVTWQDYRSSAQSPDGWTAYAHAYAQLYSDTGTPLGNQLPWPASGVPDFGEFYRFGSAPRWRFLPITYELLPDVSNGGFPAYSISLRLAEPNAMLELPPTQLGPPVVSYIEDAAINGSGRFVVDSFQCASYPPPITPPCVRGIQIFDEVMRPITAFRTADVTQTNFTAFAAINAQGQVLMNFINSSGQVVVRLYDENGSPESQEIPVKMGKLYESYVNEMKGLDDGSFVLAWIASDPMGPLGHGEALVVDRFDPHTNTFEEPVVIATTSFNFRNAVLKLNGDGRGVVVWESQDVGEGPPDFGTFTGHFRLISVTP